MPSLAFATNNSQADLIGSSNPERMAAKRSAESKLPALKMAVLFRK
ncbi:hypothetical protein KRR40_07690 [Niabella defluvii]|nr:hypothetical protein KRR40_07690 [Niabella sp. I65]